MTTNFLRLALAATAIILTQALFAQTPSGINYQAVARDANGDIMSSKSLTVKAIIATGSSGSNVEYTETHSVSTNDFGLFNIIIGQGSSSNNFGALDWGAKKHHLKIEIDAGSGFVALGTVAFESVPYALIARDVENMPAITMNDLSDVNASGASNGQVLEWDGTEWKPVTPSSGSSYTAGNGITITGNTIEAASNSPIWNANKLTGNSVSSSAPSSGQVLKWNGTAWSPDTDNSATYTGGTGITITGTSVAADAGTALWNANKLSGNNVATTAPSTNQVLKWNGTTWSPAMDNNTTYTAGTGITITGTSVAASAGTALWNANKLSGTNIATTTPTSGQVLQYNGTNWTPTTMSGSPWSTVGTKYANIYRNIGIGIDTSSAKLHIQDTISSSLNTTHESVMVLTQGATVGTSNTYAGWYSVSGRGGFQNTGIRGWAGDTASSLYAGGGATGGRFIAMTIGGQNNFGVRADAGDGGSVRNYAVYAHSRGQGTFNMGIFAYCSGVNTVTNRTNYGIYAWADSATTNYAGYFAGNVTYTGTLAAASDARLKTNIEPLQDALKRVNQVQVSTYEYKKTGSAAKLNLPEGQQIGFIAQDLEKSFPELVEEQTHAVGAEADSEKVESVNYKAVNYIGMIPVLTKAIQEQQEYIKMLEKRLSELEAKQNQ